MNEEKSRILLRLYKDDLITADEFLILFKEEPIYMPSTTPNWTPAQPFINTPYYTSGTGARTSAGDISITKSGSSVNQQTTIGGSFSKKWINPEEP